MDLGTGAGGYLSPSRTPDDVRVMLVYKTLSILLILRVDAARSLVDTGEFSLAVIAGETGFGDTERMRRAFVRTLGQPPHCFTGFSGRVPHLVHGSVPAHGRGAIGSERVLGDPSALGW
ncbi:helix-turn-helix domain-containing protein [Paraburkholderia sp. 31.1]|uniref:helix-turn-helix domain-containing protein n=1 Tax=Paraburkholderia sp. 31.1 TaxID=2615205 RepID=UPI003976093B